MGIEAEDLRQEGHCPPHPTPPNPRMSVFATSGFGYSTRFSMQRHHHHLRYVLSVSPDESANRHAKGPSSLKSLQGRSQCLPRAPGGSQENLFTQFLVCGLSDSSQLSISVNKKAISILAWNFGAEISLIWGSCIAVGSPLGLISFPVWCPFS